MKIRLAADLQSDSIVDGEGIRTVIWTQGCLNHCKGCQNPETWDMNGGQEFDVEEIKEQISNLEGQTGITFSGGDPMFQVDACLELAKHCQEKGFNVWCFTGFTYEELLERSKKEPNIIEFLKNIDTLVDGRFLLEERSLNLKFKGSKNQRIIDVKKTMKSGEIVLDPRYVGERDYSPLMKKNKHIYI